MGAKDSKPTFLTYEEASKRVTDLELKRLKDAFKRSSTLSGYMSMPIFIREVLGDGVPPKLAEQIFIAFGGTSKGLNLKDLVCGLVLLTRSKQEEKLKFIFGVYANESLTFVQQDEMDRLILATEGHVPQALCELFQESDHISYEVFRQWILENASFTSLTKWLLEEPCSVTLTNDSETPTFYQTLAGVTHLEETDIIELEKRYWLLKAQSKSGKFDLETFRPVICPPIPDSLCEGVFYAFDENRDNHIDFKEMACGISACCRGPLTERQKFCFKIFDADHDSLLNRQELMAMITAMMMVRKENKWAFELASDGLNDVNAEQLAEEILEKYDADQDGCITQEEYLVWTVGHTLPNDFLNLLFQVSHVVLGLKPDTREEEGQVIRGWIEREERRGLQVGQTWYLVTMQWWKEWNDYVFYQPPPIIRQSSYSDMQQMAGSNGRFDSLKRSRGNRASSLCRNLRGGSYNTWEDNTVVVTNVTSLSEDYVTANGLPQSAMQPRSLINGSPTRTSVDSCNSSLSPAPSPRLGKRNSFTVATPQKPGAIDNMPLILPNSQKISVLTNEGGRLKRNTTMARGRDFEILPDPVWRALSTWYGGTPALPRTVIKLLNHDGGPELELYPIHVRLLRYQITNQRPPQGTSSAFSAMVGGLGNMTYTGTVNTTPPIPRKYLAYTASFSRKHTLRQVYEFLCSRLRIGREDMRLWKVKDEQNMILLEEEELTMEHLSIEDNQQMLIEVRNKDLTWPEEMSQLAKNKAAIDKSKQVPTQPGATGLNNLGNTCFMNSAIQCVSSTRILTLYFTGGMHLYELNRNNPLGMKGHVAQRYGDLVKDLWSGTAKSLAPLKFRWTIGKYAPRFNGFQQHDSQELLAFLLDGLHEDLNRVHDKPYVELKDSDGRPDEEVAKEAWENHVLRNRSIIVDLFHGQLKSQVRCMECGHISVRFDPFTYLSLPLPMESCIHLEIILMRLDGTVPVKYGLRLNMDEKYKGLTRQLSELSNIPASQILLVEVFGALVKSLPNENHKIKLLLGGNLYAYELPPTRDITAVVVEEEEYSAVQKLDQKGLNQIQRMPLSTASSSEGLPPVNTSESVNGIPNNHLNNQKSWPQSQNNTPDKNHISSSVSSTNSQQLLSPNPNQECDIPAYSKPQNHHLESDERNSSQGSASSNNSSGISTSHKRNDSNISDCETNGSVSSGGQNSDRFAGFVVAVHRKMIRMDVYFLSSQKSRPSLFGIPLILPCGESTTNQDLYQSVWMQMARLVSPLPPSEVGTPNHAQDCDDSLGYEYPFTLKVVQRDGLTCAWCPWYRFCRGCKLECNMEKLVQGCGYIAVDWEPTALHLRYQTSQERVYNEHRSVEESRRLQTEPIHLDTCLQAFTKEEELGEDELYYCSKCKAHRLAAKKLQIWKLPPLLIIHLKRFQFLNGRWVKSQKIVKFPREKEKFDPSAYVVQRGEHSKPVQNKLSLANGSTNHNRQENASYSINQDHNLSKSVINDENIDGDGRKDTNTAFIKRNSSCESSENSVPKNNNNHLPHGLQKDSMSPQTVSASSSQEKAAGDHYSHHSNGSADVPSGDEDYKNVTYDLYALSCHTGIMGGGHYVAYTKHPNQKWYCYNDSSCKEVCADQIDADNAYILFYERSDLDYGPFMPNITGKEPDTQDIDDDFENDFKRMCTIQ